MKIKILGGIFALAVMVATGYGVNKSMQHDADLSDMALSNVEALAAWWDEEEEEEDTEEGILYGNLSGNRYCCCPGDNGCSAAACSNSFCN